MIALAVLLFICATAFTSSWLYLCSILPSKYRPRFWMSIELFVRIFFGEVDFRGARYQLAMIIYRASFVGFLLCFAVYLFVLVKIGAAAK